MCTVTQCKEIIILNVATYGNNVNMKNQLNISDYMNLIVTCKCSVLTVMENMHRFMKYVYIQAN